MNTAERVVRIVEVEEIVSQLVELGWRSLEISYTDTDGDPFQVTFTLEYDGDSVLQEAL